MPDEASAGLTCVDADGIVSALNGLLLFFVHELNIIIDTIAIINILLTEITIVYNIIRILKFLLINSIGKYQEQLFNSIGQRDEKRTRPLYGSSS
jgi:hypothetical protein